jgi:membrane-associated phospholipid phosphatase
LFQVYKDSKLFYILSLLFALIGAIVLINTAKGDVEIWVNQFHNPSLNIFFYWITYLGDGFFSFLVIIALFFRRVYWGILSVISFLATGVVTQFLKRIVFEGFPRPSRFFDPSLIHLKYVEGLDLHGYFSFPSGHSSGAFSVFLLLSLISKKPLIQLVCFFTAIATAISRIYLLQHFFMDIYAGTILGIIVTSFLYYFIEYRSKLSTNERLKQPLIGVFKKK